MSKKLHTANNEEAEPVENLNVKCQGSPPLCLPSSGLGIFLMSLMILKQQDSETAGRDPSAWLLLSTDSPRIGGNMKQL